MGNGRGGNGRTLRLLAACAAAALALAGAAAGCAGRYGTVNLDASVTKLFESGEVVPGHSYYTAGSDTSPDAIIALRLDRPLRDDLWRPATMTPELLRRLVDRMKGSSDAVPLGRAIRGERGEALGVWYSRFNPSTVTLLDDGGVRIEPPVTPSEGSPKRSRDRD